MSEPIFFVIERGPGGREFPSIIHDLLPERLTRKGATALVYAMRLDKWPGGVDMAKRPLAVLHRLYQRHLQAGTLPQNLSDPPAKDETRRGRILGEWWTPPENTWAANQPPDREEFPLRSGRPREDSE